MNCVLVSSKGTGQDCVCAEMLGCDALRPVFSILPSLVFHSYILCFTSLHPLFYIITLLFLPRQVKANDPWALALAKLSSEGSHLLPSLLRGSGQHETVCRLCTGQMLSAFSLPNLKIRFIVKLKTAQNSDKQRYRKV